MKYILFLSAFLLFSTSQLNAQEEKLILYGFEQIDSLLTIEERPMAIFIHTDWCRYCKNMQHTTFEDEKVIKKLNEDFYFISFDAEEERTITFRSHPFEFKPNGRNSGVHSLAQALGTIEGELTYPVFVILNPSYEIEFQYNAFLSGKKMREILNK